MTQSGARTDLTETSRDELKLLLNEFKFANNRGIVALLSSHKWEY